MFILIQGNFPVIWSAISEIKGRKVCIYSHLQSVVCSYDRAQFVYLLSIALFIIGSAIVAVSRNIGLMISMRVVQAAG
jgi:MFS family permease